MAKKQERNDQICKMFADGVSLTDIGRAFGISRNRARIIVLCSGADMEQGGFRLAVENKRKTKIEDREKSCLEKYGVSAADKKHLSKIGALYAFRQQKAKAKRRGIDFNFNLKDWWKVWSESGKWDLRGVGAGSYCMARNGDVGPYETGNVSIKLSRDNNREGIAGVRARLGERFNASGASSSAFGKGRGWTLVKRNKKNPFCVQIAGLKQHSFPTQEAAERFYRDTTQALKQGLVKVVDGRVFHDEQMLSLPK